MVWWMLLACVSPSTECVVAAGTVAVVLRNPHCGATSLGLLFPARGGMATAVDGMNLAVGCVLVMGSTRTLMKASPAAVRFPCLPAGVSQISIAAMLVFSGMWGWIKQWGPMPLRSLDFQLGLELRLGLAVTVDYAKLLCFGFI